MQRLRTRQRNNKQASRPGKRKFSLAKFLARLGPGVVTGASDDDPSGIGTYAVAGASLGYSTLWTALVTWPLMAAMQLICARVGMVTGRGLAGVMRRYYGPAIFVPAIIALVLANTINAGVDIGAIAAGINLLVDVPVSVLVFPIALVLLALQVFGSYALIARLFKWLSLALLAYIGSALYARPDAWQVFQGTFVPRLRLDREYLATLVAILGTTISPYLFFWQASQEVEEEKAHGATTLRQRQGASSDDLYYAAWDVNLGMFFSNLVMYFIILATAATLHRAGQTEIRTAADAALALKPLAGEAASLLLTLGLIGSGFLAVPILTTSSAYAVCEACKRPHGLDEKPHRARLFYALIVGSTLLGTAVNFLGIDVMALLFWTGVLNGLLAPPLMVIVMLISSNKAIMGKRINGPWIRLLGWAATGLMFLAAIGLVATWGT
jgi:NRAMP (natural resistance-associated macrophage protein)-like metal ion transporter